MKDRKIKGINLTKEEILQIYDVYLNGLYDYQNLASVVYCSLGLIKKIFNADFINMYFGKEILRNIKERTELIQKLTNRSRNNVLVKNHEIRKIINQDVLFVSYEENKSLEIIMLFLKHDGDLDIVSETIKISKNSIITILNKKLSYGYLLPEVKACFDNMLEIETTLFRRDISSKATLIERVAYMKIVLKYNYNAISTILNIPVRQIYNILLDPYITIRYKKYLEMNMSDEEIKKQKILDMADLIINNDLSLGQISDLFGCSKPVISSYINEILPKLSISKYKKIRVIFDEKCDKISTEEKRLRIQKMKELYEDGYKISEIGKIFSRDQSTIYRNLLKFYPELFNKQLTKSK